MWYRIEYYERDTEGYVLNYAMEDIDFSSDDELVDYVQHLKDIGCTDITYHCVD